MFFSVHCQCHILFLFIILFNNSEECTKRKHRDKDQKHDQRQWYTHRQEKTFEDYKNFIFVRNKKYFFRKLSWDRKLSWCFQWTFQNISVYHKTVCFCFFFLNLLVLIHKSEAALVRSSFTRKCKFNIAV